MIEGLGVSFFVHNAIEYDYCLKEAVESVLPVAQEIVILDAQSTDGTLDLLQRLNHYYPKVRVYSGAVWECAKDFTRLQKIAEQAKSHLTTEYHLMVQADEVLHEDSYNAIERCVNHLKHTPVLNGFRVRRFHIYGDFEHMVSLNCPTNRKPAGDWIIRLGRTSLPIVGDAENLADNNITDRFCNEMVLFHYGYMRKSAEMLKKGIDMTYWFGGGIEPDKRLMDMQRTKRGWKPYEIMERELLEPIRKPHPAIMKEWIEEREQFYK